MRKRALASLLAATAATTGVVIPAAFAAPAGAVVQAAPTVDELRLALRAAIRAADKAEDAYRAAQELYVAADEKADAAKALAAQARDEANRLKGVYEDELTEKAAAHAAIPGLESAVTEAQAKLAAAEKALAEATPEQVEQATKDRDAAKAAFDAAVEALSAGKVRFEEAAERLPGKKAAFDEADAKATTLEGEAVPLWTAARDLEAEADRLKGLWAEAEKVVTEAQKALDAALFPVKISYIDVDDAAIRYPGKKTGVDITVYTKTDDSDADVTCGGYTFDLDETVSGVFEGGMWVMPGAPNKATCGVVVRNSHGVTASSSFTYDLQRHARIVSLNAGPEPVRKGKRITVTGVLQGTNTTGTAYGHLNGGWVSIQFRKKGSTTWSTLGGITTSGKGNFSRAFTAKADGTWRAVYGGGWAFTKATSGSDYVDVR
ncbi:hypothetical protein [Nonomuraea soli]|uniref:Putative nucleic acid-binding Zn-ribbon protein n=1 Tax=Nonomuraea soli TaxID=1032476 RepID=A0A7W0CQK0_9ACTN|nr:hypothetical protein [Nonomuraea soli]MBA2895521.1 putative nucleic acid-binding Zn-ribbon protein [Nonomuraea soli]